MQRIDDSYIFTIKELQQLMIHNDVNIVVTFSPDKYHEFLENIVYFDDIALHVSAVVPDNDKMFQPQNEIISLHPVNSLPIPSLDVFTFGTYPEIRQNIGVNVRTAINKRGLTQSAAAKALGISTGTMSNIINGTSSIKAETLAMLEERLKIKHEEILSGVDWSDEDYKLGGGDAVDPKVDRSPQIAIVLQAALKLIKDTEDYTKLVSLMKIMNRMLKRIDIDQIEQLMKQLEKFIHKLLEEDRAVVPIEEQIPAKWLLPELIHVIGSLQKALMTYKIGYETTMQRVSDNLEFIIYLNNKIKKQSHDS